MFPDVRAVGATGLWLLTSVLAGAVLGVAHRSVRMTVRGAVAVLLGLRSVWAFTLTALLVVPPAAAMLYLAGPPVRYGEATVVAWYLVVPALAVGLAVGLGTGIQPVRARATGTDGRPVQSARP